MLITKKNRREVYKYLFREGVLYAEKDFNLPEHPEIPGIPNLQVIKLMQSFHSKEYVTERFAWRHYYWFLTDEGMDHLRTYLNLPSEIVPATLKKSTRPLEKDSRPPRRFGGEGGDRPPRTFGDRPPREGGYREGYRSSGGFGRGADKGGAPGAFQPEFGGSRPGGGGGFGRGGGAPPS